MKGVTFTAINKAVQAALRAITTLDLDVKKTYRVERKIELLTARLRGQPTDYSVWDRGVTCGDHNVPVRMFAPTGEGPFPVLIFYHGGGWVTGGIENYTGVCVDLARATGYTVALVDYRLAPEYKFPAAPEDCYAVAREFFLGGVPDVDPRDIVWGGQRRRQPGRRGLPHGPGPGGVPAPAADSRLPRDL